MRIFLALVVLLSTPYLVLAQNAKKVLFIGSDGTTGSELRDIPTPNIDLLTEDAIYSYDAINNGITISGPGWSNLFTGVLDKKHKVVGNSFEKNNLANHPDFLQIIKKHIPHYETAAFYTWLPIGIILNETDTRVARRYAHGGDAFVHQIAQDYLRNEPADATVVYYGDVDIAGHNFGFYKEVPEYYREVVQFDRYVGDLVDAINDRPTRSKEDWLIVLSTDHGGHKTGHGGETLGERNIFLIVAGDPVRHSELRRTNHRKLKMDDQLPLKRLKRYGFDTMPTQVDVVPTILDFLEIPADSYDLDGASLLGR